MTTRWRSKLTDVRKNGDLWWLRLDGTTRVTIEYVQRDDGSVEPRNIHTVVISTQHTVRRLGPSIPVEAVKACALVGLHMMAEEISWRSDSGSSVSSSSSGENNAGNDAQFVTRLHGSGDTISLFLQDWELAKVPLSCHIALDMLCQELHEVERRRGWLGF